MSRMIALIYNWWNLFTRLAIPDKHHEAITSRPLLLSSMGRLTLNSDLIPLGNTVLSQAIRKKRDKLGITDFTPHDLRRTAATWITGIGLPDYTQN